MRLQEVLGTTEIPGVQWSPHADWLAGKHQQNASRIQAAVQTYQRRGDEDAARMPAQEALVLVVDDEQAIAITLADILGRHGFPSIWFTDPHAAADLLGRVPLRVLITDIDMPAMDGIALAASAGTNCPVLFLSARAGEDAVLRQLRALRICSHVEQKPIHPRCLVETVRALIQVCHTTATA